MSNLEIKVIEKSGRLTASIIPPQYKTHGLKFFIGMLGEYIGAIYAQVLKCPLVVEKDCINF